MKNVARLKTIMESSMKWRKPTKCHVCESTALSISVVWKDGTTTYRCASGHLTS